MGKPGLPRSRKTRVPAPSRRRARALPPRLAGVPPTLDTALLTGWTRAATSALERHCAEIDRINVFPVPDGDTGTNLLLTMRAAAEAVRRVVRGNGAGGGVAAVAGAMARGAVIGARGNSGVILSPAPRG